MDAGLDHQPWLANADERIPAEAAAEGHPPVAVASGGEPPASSAEFVSEASSSIRDAMVAGATSRARPRTTASSLRFAIS